MDNPLRKEITSHIEASGELACWIVPYLYHAAYQTVKEMEREGLLIIEVGKRGEPVYVFASALGIATALAAPTPPPADAPTASDTTGLLTPAFIKMLNAISEAEANNRPVTKDEVSADEQPIIDGLRNVGYIRAEREDNFVTYFITDRGREKWSSLRKPAAPTPAAAAAQAAPSEKPKAGAFTHGDKVWYRSQGGWGGGETHRAVGIVKSVTAKRAVIILYDTRSRKAIEKQVALTSLTYRPTDYALDATLAAALEGRAK
jgi:hypothetical protein